jgi:hypothetical protein
MARSSRLSVCLAIAMRNSSKIHCARSISRQCTTPGTAGIGPTLDHAGDGLALDVVELGRLLYRSIAGMACAWLRRNVHQVGDGGPRCRIMPSLTKRDIPSANRPETLRDASARSCRAERRG